jgi:general stress protein 26
MEDHVKNLQNAEAIEKLKELAEKSETCLFCTNIKTGQPFSTRPMAVQEVDDEGNLWFLSDKESNKNMELKEDDHVQLLFSSSSHAGFLNVFGKATVTYDKQKIKELWKPLIKTWFQEGQDDPNISVIKVEPKEGYYWDTKHGKMVAFLKMLTSVVVGKTMDDSIEGTIKV